MPEVTNAQGSCDFRIPFVPWREQTVTVHSFARPVFQQASGSEAGIWTTAVNFLTMGNHHFRVTPLSHVNFVPD
jgi:hypothetical protein